MKPTLSLAALAVFCAPHLGHADGAADIAALRKQVAELSARLEKMEKQAAQAKTQEKDGAVPITVKSGARVTVSGLMQVNIRGYNDADDAMMTGSGRADTFQLRRANLVFDARITRRLDATLGVNFAKRLRLIRSPLTGQGGISQRGNILQTLELSYLLHRASKDNRTYLDVGQFTLPIGYEGYLASSSALQTVDRALMFTQRDPFDGAYGSTHDTGIQLRGVKGEVDFRLGVFNGLGERQNTTALSDNKAIVGFLSVRPSRVKGLRLGLSGARGNTRNTSAPPDLPGREVLNNRADRSIINAFIVYKIRKWTLQSEVMRTTSFLSGVEGLPPAPGRSLVRREIESHYFSGGYRINEHLEFVTRYDVFNFDRQLQNAAARDITLGLNYYLKGNNAKIQANIVRRNGGVDISPGNQFSRGTSRDFQNDRTELRLNFQSAF